MSLSSFQCFIFSIWSQEPNSQSLNLGMPHSHADPPILNFVSYFPTCCASASTYPKERSMVLKSPVFHPPCLVCCRTRILQRKKWKPEQNSRVPARMINVCGKSMFQTNHMDIEGLWICSEPPYCWIKIPWHPGLHILSTNDSQRSSQSLDPLTLQACVNFLLFQWVQGSFSLSFLLDFVCLGLCLGPSSTWTWALYTVYKLSPYTFLSV